MDKNKRRPLLMHLVHNYQNVQSLSS